MAVRKKNNIGRALMTGVAAVAGGFVGNKLTSAIEIGLAKGGNKNAGRIAPLSTTLIGLLGSVWAPPQLRPAFIGMAAVGGTESLEGVEAQVMKPKVVAPTTAELIAANDVLATNTTISGQSRVKAYNTNGQVRTSAYNSIGKYNRYSR